MATNLAPHNLTAIYESIIHIIDKTLEGTEANIDDIIDIMKAPDFPTGGTIMGLSGVKEAFKTGKGRIVLRSKYEIEEFKGKQQIIFTEIPYRVNKSRLIEKIAELIRDKKIETISDIRDESDKDGMRIVITLKRDQSVQLTLAKLFKHTQLQDSFSVNNVVLVNKIPRTLSIKEMLEYFLAHTADIIMKRTQYDLIKAQERAHIVEGTILALDNIKSVIEVIQAADSNDDAIATLVEMGLSEIQAKSVIDMKLRSLAKASREKIEEELIQLQENIVYWNSILESQEVLLNVMKAEFTDLKEKFGDERKTEISLSGDSNIDEEDLVTDENLIITITTTGLIKSVEENTYKTQGRGGKGVKATNTKEDEIIKELIMVNSKDDLLFFTDQGRCHVLKAYKIEKASRIARGKSLVNYLNLNPDEVIKSIISTSSKDPSKSLLMVTQLGTIKRLELEQLSARNVTKVIGIKENDALVSALIVNLDSNVIITTAYGQAIRLAMNTEGVGSIRPMGRQASGVKGITFKNKKDYVVDMTIADDDSTIFTITEKGLGKRTIVNQYPSQNRGGKGVVSHKVNDKTGLVVASATITDDDELFIATEQGLITRLSVKKISTLGRNTSGVKIMNLNEGDKIVSISKIATEQEIIEGE